jgi:homoserine O-succinyltransferase
MPLKIPINLPAVEVLRKENIFVMDSERAENQEIRPLKIVILNLMPLKITTETDLIRLLSNTPLQIEIDFLKLKSHTPKNTPIEHLMEFYKSFDIISKSNYDGMIVTGAPVEQLPFEEVKYWKELTEIFDWAKEHVTSTFYICWAAQAGLYHFYGVPKHLLPEKIFGVYEHVAYDKLNPIFRGFDDVFYVPHSRHTELHREDILTVPELTLLSESPVSGVYMVMARNGRDIFITGHSEYSAYTLDSEYKRDLKKGLPIRMPDNYYRDNNPKNEPVVRWRSHANLLFTNWLNYFVYQETPYDLSNVVTNYKING